MMFTGVGELIYVIQLVDEERIWPCE